LGSSKHEKAILGSCVKLLFSRVLKAVFVEFSFQAL
jgi:hypothetical protein